MLELILIIALLGFITYMVVTYIPMPDAFKTAIYVIVAILLILYIVRLFGVDIPLPRTR